jgi:hypothetical protein
VAVWSTTPCAVIVAGITVVAIIDANTSQPIKRPSRDSSEPKRRGRVPSVARPSSQRVLTLGSVRHAANKRHIESALRFPNAYHVPHLKAVTLLHNGGR